MEGTFMATAPRGLPPNFRHVAISPKFLFVDVEKKLNEAERPWGFGGGVVDVELHVHRQGHFEHGRQFFS